jgi:hypothetical protein
MLAVLGLLLLVQDCIFVIIRVLQQQKTMHYTKGDVVVSITAHDCCVHAPCTKQKVKH